MRSASNVDGFLARCDILCGPGQSPVDRPGLHGVFSSDDPPSARLVIDDDQAIEALPELLAHTPGGMVNVLATAPRAAALLERHERWPGRAATAMITRDLRAGSSHGHLIFVNTHLDKRGEGIGRAMTVLTLADARARGAAAAYLDASGEGRRLYAAMGFQTAAALTRFSYQK